MSNPRLVLQSLFVYLICLPLAVMLGYFLANPSDLTSFGTIALMLLFLSVPLLLRYHYPLMLLAWNASVVLFFLPGRPQLWLAAAGLSIVLTLAHRMMDKQARFIQVPELIWPLVMLVLVIVITASATGGIGLRSMGGELYGGKRYIELLFGVIGFFAISWQRIPQERVHLYLALFFLGGITSFIGDLYSIAGPLLMPLFLFFPPTGTSLIASDSEMTRFVGLTGASSALFSFMLAKYGVRGIFAEGKPWRLLLFASFCLAGFFGGYRSLIISFILIFTMQFFLEGMHRTRLLPALTVALVMIAALGIPTLKKLPPAFQRALAFLPVPIDPMVRQDADSSSEWRLRIWRVVLPQVPQYLLLGKGYAMTQADFAVASRNAHQHDFEENWSATLAGDYHNGPLSIIISFGIWGAAAFVWFLGAAFRVLYKNYRYGNPEFRGINSFLFAIFTARVLMFFFIFGSFYSDFPHFVAWVALSISINGGVARAAPIPAPETKTAAFSSVLARPRSAFSR
jgi:O-antigen ligase